MPIRAPQGRAEQGLWLQGGAKGFLRLEIRPEGGAALAADGGHRPGRLAEALLADVVLELFSPDGIPDQCLELWIGCTVPQRLAQICLVKREEAGAQLALGGQTHAVAVG